MPAAWFRKFAGVKVPLQQAAQRGVRLPVNPAGQDVLLVSSLLANLY